MHKPIISCTHMHFNEAKEKLKERYSCLEVVRTSEHVAVSPRCIGSPKDINAGIKTVLDAKLNTFSSRHNGVPVAYGNICWLDSMGRIHADNPLIHFSVALDFIIFRPKMGLYVSGTVNKVSTDHLGVLIHNIFNASILKPNSAHAQASDLSQKNIREGQEIIFEITGMHVYNSLLAIEGKLVDISRKPEMAKEIGNMSSLMSKASDTVGVGDVQQKTTAPNMEYLTKTNANDTSKASTLNTSLEKDSELKKSTKLKHLGDERPRFKDNQLNVSTSVKKRIRSSDVNNEEIDSFKVSNSTKKKARHLLKEDYSEQTVTAFVDVESERKKRKKCLLKTVCVEGEKLVSSVPDLRRKNEKHKEESLKKEEFLLDSCAEVQELGKKKRHKK